MSPPTHTIPLSELDSRLNTLPSGKQRKPPVKLSTCALKELVQYKCNAEMPKKGAQPLVVCEPVVRLFRQCADGLHVETTAWEGWKAGQEREG